MDLKQPKISGVVTLLGGATSIIIPFPGGKSVTVNKSFIKFSVCGVPNNNIPNNQPHEWLLAPEFTSIAGGIASEITIRRGASLTSLDLDITWRVFEMTFGTVEHLPVTALTSLDQNIPIPAGKWTDGITFIIAYFTTSFTTWGTNLDPKSFQVRHVNVTSNDFVKVKGNVFGNEDAYIQVIKLPTATIHEVITSLTGTSTTSAAFPAVTMAQTMHFSTFLMTDGANNANATHIKSANLASTTTVDYTSYASYAVESVTYVIDDPGTFAQHGTQVFLTTPDTVTFGTSVQEDLSLAIINGQSSYWGRSSGGTVNNSGRWSFRNTFNNPDLPTTSFDIDRGSLTSISATAQWTVAEFTLNPFGGHDQFYRMNRRRR